MFKLKLPKYLFGILGFICLIIFSGASFENKYSDKSISINPIVNNRLSIGAKHLIDNAFEGLDSTKLIDYHMHIVGTGDLGSGTFVKKEMLTYSHPYKHIKFDIYLNAAGVKNSKKADEEYLITLISRIRNSHYQGKYCLLAFDKNYYVDGTPNLKKTEFYVPNEYVFQLAQKYPDIFIPVISVHPYRKDAIAELEKWARKGVRMIKWLPNAMGIDPSSPKCDNFYRKMKENNMLLLTHAGEEKAVDAEEDQKFGNPLLLKVPLDAGVKVIIAHCASLGDAEIKNDDKKITKRKNFDLFMELMHDKKYENLLFADISAMTQYNRMGIPLKTMLDNTELHKRLVNGSDYPLPAINFLIRTSSLEKAGYITSDERRYLNEIYTYNPLLFDFVLKRTIKSPITKLKFSNSVFMSNQLLGF